MTKGVIASHIERRPMMMTIVGGNEALLIRFREKLIRLTDGSIDSKIHKVCESSLPMKTNYRRLQVPAAKQALRSEESRSSLVQQLVCCLQQ